MDTSRLTPIIRAFEDELGDVFVALLLVGSAATNYYLPGHSDVNLMLVIRRDATLQQVQKVVSAQWSIWENTLRTPPTVAYQSAFFRHLRLNPALNLHIQTYARLLSGQVPDPYPQPNQLKVLAAYCTAALTASAALSAPRSISPTTSPAYDQLHRLARRLTAYPLSEKATARQLFIIVQRELQSRLEQFRGLDKSPPTPTNNLEAIYSQLQQIVFVIPELSERQLAALDWSTIAASLDKPFQTIGVTTPAQFRLSLLVDAPIDYALDRYTRQWGRDLFRDHPVSRGPIYRALARHASDLLVNTLPQRYLKAGHAKEKNKVIHDLQNQVLNLHLQAELLRRTHGFPFSVPSIKLPGRETPVDQRIHALHKWLDYWAAYYIDAGEQNSPA